MSDIADAKTWFITGCSSGFGRCLVETALAHGQRVVATARDVRSLNDLEGPRCTTLALDVTDPESIARAVREAHNVLGQLDVVVNNAGYGLIGAVEECSDDQIRRSMETNYFGPLNIIRAVLPPAAAASDASRSSTIRKSVPLGNRPVFPRFPAGRPVSSSMASLMWIMG